MFFVYILKSNRDGKSYVGSTTREVNKRIDEHNIGSNKWTSKHTPFKLIYYESFECKKDMILRERFYKSGVGKKIKKVLLDNLGD